MVGKLSGTWLNYPILLADVQTCQFPKGLFRSSSQTPKIGDVLEIADKQSSRTKTKVIGDVDLNRP